MTALYPDLSTQEREVARKLWDDLVLSSGKQAKSAQQQMVDAPSSIQQALITAIVQGLRSQQELQSLPNPFVCKGE